MLGPLKECDVKQFVLRSCHIGSKGFSKSYIAHPEVGYVYIYIYTGLHKLHPHISHEKIPSVPHFEKSTQGHTFSATRFPGIIVLHFCSGYEGRWLTVIQALYTPHESLHDPRFPFLFHVSYSLNSIKHQPDYHAGTIFDDPRHDA